MLMNNSAAITRRGTLKRLALGAALCAVPRRALAAASRRPPHIIYLMADQLKASAMSLYGNRYSLTPTFERIAAQGVTFDNAHVQSPICTPSRASVMTGTYPLVHRVLCHQNHAPRNLPQLAELLAEQGYHCMVAGHYEAERSLTRGWHRALDWLGTPRLRAAMQAHYGCGSKEVGWAAGETEAGPAEAHAAVLNDEVEAALDAVDPKAAPIFLHVAFIEPHPPYFAPRGYLNSDAAQHLPLPPLGDISRRPAWHQAMLRDFGTEKATEADVRRLLAAYYGMTRYVDDQIGRLIRYLERRGIADNAWIVLSSDHGDFAGEKGFFLKAETSYECLTRVPLVIRGPGGRWHPGTRVRELVETIDLFPTLLAAAGAPMSRQAQGFDLNKWMSTRNRTPLRATAFAAVGGYEGNLKTTLPAGLAESGRRKSIVRSARSLDHLYIRDPDHGDEAYDLKRDPLELHNLLSGGSAPTSAIARLSRQLDQWEQQCQRHAAGLNIEPGDRNFSKGG